MYGGTHIIDGFGRMDRWRPTPSNCEKIVDALAKEIIDLLARDRYLVFGKETGNKFLNLIDAFFKEGGDPFYSFGNILVGNILLERQTIFELLHLLWKLPYRYELNVEGWKFESEEIVHRFIAQIEHCKFKINHMLQYNQLKGENYLSLIRCVTEFCDDDGDGSRFDGSLSEELGNQFVTLMEYFVYNKVDPNLTFSQIGIGNNLYNDLTCFQVIYLIWKHPKTNWNEALDQRFKVVFTHVLSDPRIELMQRFSEFKLATNHHHFLNPIFLNPDNPPSTSSHYTGGWDYIKGHSLERITIAHYAVIVNDYEMLNAFLEREPRLLNLTCCLTRGKSVLHRELGKDEYYLSLSSGKLVSDKILEEDDRLSGHLTVYWQDHFRRLKQLEPQIYRITKVSMLHLAARAGHREILACLTPRHPDLAAVDSENRIPQHYLNFSIDEKIIEDRNKAKRMLSDLNPVTKLQRHLALPEINSIICREGYDLVYNTSRKVAFFTHQRLGRDSFGDATRIHHKWIDNLEIPELNRVSDKDYQNSGYDRGHLVPAGDATRSEAAMRDTFHPENAVPQNPNLNRGAWSHLESHVRELALNNDLIEVFTGPLFLPTTESNIRMIKHPVIGMGNVHVPTHLFKIIFIHNHDTKAEVYLFPNEALPKGKKFSEHKYEPKQAIDFIQKHSGIMFNEWIQISSKKVSTVQA